MSSRADFRDDNKTCFIFIFLFSLSSTGSFPVDHRDEVIACNTLYLVASRQSYLATGYVING